MIRGSRALSRVSIVAEERRRAMISVSGVSHSHKVSSVPLCYEKLAQ
jgi:hypothetical protein